MKVSVDTSQLGVILQQKLEQVVNDAATRLAVHNTLAKMCDPYVPMQTGTLAQTTRITPEGVTYTQPYAHYQYEGQVYGPNIPIVQDGVIVGWFSRPGQKKEPTGAQINYSKELHPLASAHWDKAMLRDKREQFEKEVTEIVIRRYKES